MLLSFCQAARPRARYYHSSPQATSGRLPYPLPHAAGDFSAAGREPGHDV